jgi:hypothetical protein
MQKLRPRYQATVFWLPLAGLMVVAWLAGGSIKSYTQVPDWGAAPMLAGGLALSIGGLVALYQPPRFRHWFAARRATWRDVSQSLYAVVFGVTVCIWAALALAS